jgi:hypothetical protein
VKVLYFLLLLLALPLNGQNLQEKQSFLQQYRPLLISGAAGFVFGAVVLLVWHLRQDDF